MKTVTEPFRLFPKQCTISFKLFLKWILIQFFDFLIISSDIPVVEKEVEDVDAPKVVDEDEKEVVENGKSDEVAVVAEAVPENGTSEAEPDVTSTPVVEEPAVVEAKNGDSTGKQ